ncbi:MAG: hypothetical protein A3F53_02565 [Candidatus Zambryskibacteria bacterium RIFCSPHIGHO2_12_FULL_48_10]|uniref:VIT family protein n=1 Tax=Candidatus Zambryskibacteria bacterium RIFCSPHIGHO2_01_FULL_46_25 TaxID=1802738 RepID=A0A1G2T092_9BACT|nr:MAG: hypothetical protein UX71_C0002G0012 [Parcubacteria group bacterium GW2011_GWA1_47_10]OHA90693.1 MAG: hypothetical protein A2838_03215 [Candidatus Zambryskibacteria bacterium RIFCSPHIGHO2_01_FULL_46_25]OHB02755.1 MAG: hypothetical protein A3F53_02565 [Candidatus Zambryskibacteria bacterium RIFCSPHIGHO2_12_FULL_48_10]OHB07337.1 MAG: hypothetical protein A3A31_02355 [Candidatus Zambryskibacteria bacterium RIFCSPLOWO2_01_FULL_48_25]
MFKKAPFVSYFRNFIFGVEDSLVSTVGLLSGVAIAGVAKETIFLTGIVLIFVEAFSMAAGSFLSESTAEEYESGSNKVERSSFISGAVMFFSYFLSGLIPLAPYLAWPVSKALPSSIALSVAALFLLGIVGAKVTKTSVSKNTLRMVAIGGTAIAIGIATGSIVSFY